MILDDFGYDGRENMYRALCCGSCLCYEWPNMQAAYMDSWLAWLAWALIGGNAEGLKMWKAPGGAGIRCPPKRRTLKNISTTTIARKWFCGEEILYKARLISLEKNYELKDCGCAIIFRLIFQVGHEFLHPLVRRLKGLTEIHSQCTPTVNAHPHFNYFTTFKIRQNGQRRRYRESY
jgi:hypothetical protein